MLARGPAVYLFFRGRGGRFQCSVFSVQAKDPRFPVRRRPRNEGIEDEDDDDDEDEQSGRASIVASDIRYPVSSIQYPP
jgi:hypothetical protein